jgi:CHAT domain-containing protein
VIVPTLGLGVAPFALLRPRPRGGAGAGPLLIDRMSISLASNLLDVGAAAAPWKWGFQHPLVVGDPAITEKGFERLPAAEREARRVAARLQARPLLGAEATRERVLQGLVDADFVYLATHAVASTQSPLDLSQILLVGPRHQGLTPREIQRLRLRAHLVVLSACQGGLGGIHKAGIIGLARAFHAAGVPRVVMSLWNVDDQATDQLMESLVKNLETMMPAEALRQAMLRQRQRTPDPVKWAPFVLFGTPR